MLGTLSVHFRVTEGKFSVVSTFIIFYLFADHAVAG